MNYISINTLMDRITRSKLTKNIPLETVIDLTIEFIKLVGMPPIFEEKTECIEVIDYRAQLPCDFYKVIQVRLIVNNAPSYALRSSTDSFHSSQYKYEYNDLTYKINNNIIFTSIDNCTIEVAYEAIPVDDNGYPLLPDEASFIKALSLYIKKYWFTDLFDQGDITGQVLTNVKQDYSFAVGQCQSALVMPSIDEMESISNMWNKMLPDVIDNHATGFIFNGTKEHIKTH